MRAWLLDRQTGLDALRLAEMADPVPGEGEVVLEMVAAALNPADRYLAEAQYPGKPALPHILGRDGIGTVVAIGPGVDKVGVGQRRIVLRGELGVTRPGTFAERVAAPISDLVEVPPDWNEAQAAGASLVYLTAHQALSMWGPLPAGSVVLVSGASGGVGVATVQLATSLGLTVVALSRSADKRRRLLELGARYCFDPGQKQWRREAKQALAPRRVDLVVDNIGGTLLPEAIDTLGDCGRVSIVGRLAGPVPSFNTASLFFRRIRMGGVAVSANTNLESRAVWQDVLDLLGRTDARPMVDKIFPFEKLPEAFAHLAAGPMGKVVLRVKR